MRRPSGFTMRRAVPAALAAALWACDGSSNLQVRGGEKPVLPLTGTAVPQGPATPVIDPAKIPEGTPFLPPLAGHRLAVKGALAVVSDPEGEQADGRSPRVYAVDLSTGESKSIVLPDGSRPGAIELTANGHAWVVLEGSGGVAAIDTAAAKVTRFYSVCRAPVDLTFGSSDVWVACLSGEVVRLTGATMAAYRLDGVPTRIANVGGKIHVALSNAAVVQVDETGMSTPVRPPDTSLTPTHGASVRRTGWANSPRRLVPTGRGGVALLHQQSVEGELVDPQAPAESPYSGGPPTPTSCPTPATRDNVSTTDDLNAGFQAPVTLGTTLPIDLAVPPSGNVMAIADPAIGRVLLQPRTVRAQLAPNGCPTPVQPMASLNVAGVSSLAYDEADTLVTLSGTDALMVNTFAPGATTASKSIMLRARNVPTGFTLFHATPKPMSPTEPNVSCASCHPSGMNNGGVLTVNGVSRKVMMLGSHLAAATGVHWDNVPFQQAVVEGTWHTNMQGKPLTVAEAASLKSFVEQLRPATAPTADEATLQLGRVAYGKAACGSCHDPSSAFTNNSQANVGRGMHRVPSLVGLAYSAPYMADGCAKTLEERFSKVACGGGEQHGHPANLSADELGALIVYLKTL